MRHEAAQKRRRPLSWSALLAVAALHGALFAALAHALAPHLAAPPGERVTMVALLPAQQAQALPPPPALPLASAVTPALHPPAIAIAEGQRSVATAPAAAAAAAAPPAVATASHDAVLDRYGALLWSAIAAHKRPGLHRAGTVRLAFTLDPAGRLVTLSIARSSGDAMLDAEAQRAVRTAAPFAPPPPALGPRDLFFTLAFEFS